MKTRTAVAPLLFFLFCCSQNKENKASVGEFQDKLPKIEFAEDISKPFDFGELKEGDVVEHTYSFKNAGEFPLIINNVGVSCGCTASEWPREPVAPGDTSSIKIKFNTKGKAGPQAKTITVFANTSPASTSINFTAVVSVIDSAKSSK